MGRKGIDGKEMNSEEMGWKEINEEKYEKN